MKKMLVIEKLNKHYNQQMIFNDLDFSLEYNKIYGVMGPSGIGKSTLLKIIAGLETIDEGRITINDELCHSKKYVMEPYKRNLGFVFQEATLWPHMTMRENIEFAIADNYKIRLEEIITTIGLKDIMHKYPNEISEGEAKRVSIARAICSGAKLLLLDEPYANLDEKTKIDLMNLIKMIQVKEKLTILMVSHDLSEHTFLSDKLFEIKAGKIYEKS
jgi:ABC-type sugar transport system ATPase subunit